MAAGAIVVGESLAVLTTVEFLETPDDGKVFGAAAAVLEMTAGLDGAGAELDAAGAGFDPDGARLGPDGVVTGVEPLGTGAGVADTDGIAAAVEDAGT